MSNAIFTLAIGEKNPMYEAALLSFESYAKKVNAKLIVSKTLHYPITIQNPKYCASPAWAEKLHIGELLNQYERVLYLDADMIISPNASNVFERYPKLDTVYMFNEGKIQDRQSVINEIMKQKNTTLAWPTTNNKPIYYNLGCMLISKQSQLFEYAKLADLQSLCNHIKYYEQTYFNFLLHKHYIPHESIDRQFNRMDMLGKKDYLEADFIHYAGRGFSNSSLKRELKYVNDFCFLFKDHYSSSILQDLKHSALENFVDKLVKRFKLPRFILTYFANNYISV